MPLKLLRDSGRFFPALLALSASESLNGEIAYEFDPEAVLGAPREYSCRPERLLFLQRASDVEWCIRRVSPREVIRQFGPALERIPDAFADARLRQLAIIEALAEHPAYVLMTSLNPHEIADRLSRWFDNGNPTSDDVVCDHLPAQFEVPDLLRRFVPASFSFNSDLTGLKITTNIKALADRSGDFLEMVRQLDWKNHTLTIVEDEAEWSSFGWANDRFTVRGMAKVGIRISDGDTRRTALYVSPGATDCIPLLLR